MQAGGSASSALSAGASKPKSAEMHPGPGFRVRREIERADPEVIASLAGFDTPEISDLMNRLYTMSSQIRNLTAPHVNLTAPACPVKPFPAANLMPRKSPARVQ